jgi:hypothetical protein
VNRGLLLAIVVVGAALTASALAQEAAPPARDSAPAGKETVSSTASPVHSGSQGSVSQKDSASRPTGAVGANAAGNGTSLAGKGAGQGDKPSRGAPKGAGKDIGIGENPIDMRITVQPRTSKKPPLTSEKKTSIPATPPPRNPVHDVVPRNPASTARNAIGARLDEHAKPQAAIPPSVQGSGHHFDAVNPSTVGAARASQGGANASGAGSPPRSPAVITGTGMTRPGSGPGTLGGPAKNTTAINGSNIRVKP